MSSKVNITGYNKWSEFYDEYPNPTVAIDEIFFTQAYSEVKNKKVLEIGCGTGRHTQKLIAAGNTVVGIDLSEGMLEKAKQKVQSPQVQFIHADFLTEEIPNHPFDAIVMSLVLEHIKDLNAFFAKAQSLIKENGKIYFSEIHPDRSNAGVMAHFKQVDGSEFQLDSTAHSQHNIEIAAESNGFKVESCESVCGVKELSQLNPKWAKYLDAPMIQIWVLQSKG